MYNKRQPVVSTGQMLRVPSDLSIPMLPRQSGNPDTKTVWEVNFHYRNVKEARWFVKGMHPITTMAHSGS